MPELELGLGLDGPHQPWQVERLADDLHDPVSAGIEDVLGHGERGHHEDTAARRDLPDLLQQPHAIDIPQLQVDDYQIDGAPGTQDVSAAAPSAASAT
jgi:hypothetical protein